MYGLHHRNVLPPSVAAEFDGMLAAIRGYTSVAHDDEGSIINPGVVQFSTAEVTATQSTSSASFTDVPGAAITLTTLAGSAVLLAWSGLSKTDTAGTQAQLSFSADGRDEPIRGATSMDDYNSLAAFTIIRGMTASSHTFKVRFRSEDGVATHTIGGVGYFIAIEIKVA